MYIGDNERRSVKIATSSPNRSVIVTGLSGTGKSCRMHKIELNEARNGNTIIVLDVTPSHTSDRIFSGISPSFESLCNRIDAVKDGLNIPFLSPLKNAQGETESEVRMIQSLTNCFFDPRMGIKQKGALRKTISAAIILKSILPTMNDSLILMKSLESLQDENQDNASIIEYCWDIINSHVFRSSDRYVVLGKINILDFSGFDIPTAAKCVEIVLDYLWRIAYFSGFPKEWGKVSIVIDECHLLPLRQDSNIGIMLTEGRKFGLNLIIATQTFSILKPETQALLAQAGTHIIFRPDSRDEKFLRKRLDAYGNRLTRTLNLGNLSVGEAVALGNLECGGYPVNGAILTY